MDLDQVSSLWRNKPVQSNIANPGDLVKIHIIAGKMAETESQGDASRVVETVQNKSLADISEEDKSMSRRVEE